MMTSRRMIFYSMMFCLVDVISGCATQPKQGPQKKEQAVPTVSGKVEKIDNQKYLVPLATTSVRAMRSPGSDCPKSRYTGKTSDWGLLVKKASACSAVGDWKRVEELGGILATEHHQAPWGAFYLSLVAEKQNDIDRALWMNELALRKAPDVGLFHYHKARLLWGRQSFGEAVTLVEKAVSLDPQLVDGHVFLAHLYWRDQNRPLAEKHANFALAVEGQQPIALRIRSEMQGGQVSQRQPATGQGVKP